MNLPQNLFDDNVHIQTLLCRPDKKIIGEIIPYNFKATFKFNSYSQISFSVDRLYNDLIDGTTKVNPYYELIESLRVIYLLGIGHFIIQDVEEDASEIDSKSVTCFSLEYATGQKHLENFYVNTGEEGSIETMYHAQQYGAEYSIDNYYREITDNDVFDAYERYYIKEPTDKTEGNNTYNYVETQILDGTKFNLPEQQLYVKKYPNVRFYWPTCPELSLLHNVFDRIPEWKIGHVDKDLWYQERTFNEDRTSVYDFLYNTAADTLKFVMVWDSINGVCNFYQTTEDGMTTDNYVRTNAYNPSFIYYVDNKGTEATPQPTSEKDVVEGVFYINIGKDIDTQWNTDVYISRENLASALDVKYSTDDIKTKLKISGSDSLDVRDVNLGQNYILNLDYYIPSYPVKSEWVDGDLQDKYLAYKSNLVDYTTQYKELISTWAAAYNEYNDLVNYVPLEPRVMLIGDEFEKLYCVYNQYKSASQDYDDTLTYYQYNRETLAYDEVEITEEQLKDGKYYVKASDVGDLVSRLQTKLETYKVDQQNGKPSETAKTDDVLLTLENDNSDSATIRVRYDSDGETYCVHRTRTDASTGVSNTIRFTLEEWVSGALTANCEFDDGRKMNLAGFKIKSIGTLGAYFCLVRDETEKANLEDYGIKLLQEKQDAYTKIFIAQTEGYMNEEGSQCVTSNKEPEGDEYPIGTKWLDTENTDSNGKLIMKIRESAGWTTYTPDDNDYENYARFYENYVKLGNVQAVLAEKQKRADYLLNGMPVDAIRLARDNINLYNLLRVAMMHFVILNNDYYIVKSGEALPNGGVSEGAVLFLTDEKSSKVSVYKYTTTDGWKESNDKTKITLEDYDSKFGFITFSIDSDDNKYAAYVIDGVPYVSYIHSQGLCLSKMNFIKEKVDMNNPENFSKEDLISLSPFIREDEFSDSNFLLTGYESEEEQMNIKQELLKAGDEELKKICQPKLSFDATMSNILAIPEFAPIRNQFRLGNFVRVEIREGYVKRARLLEVQIDFDDPSDFSCTFGDLISTRSEIDKHAELLEQAVTAGRAVASNQSKWQRGADKATELDNAINDGLKDATLAVANGFGQSISWDSRGILCRKMNETTGEYYDEQMLITNNRLVATSDNWKTSNGVFGKYNVNGQDHWGVLANAVVAGYVSGSVIEGGRLEIGGKNPGDKKFIVKEDGSVEIGTIQKNDDGTTSIQSVYATTDALQQIKNAYQYSVRLEYEGSTIITGNETSGTTITAVVYKDGKPYSVDSSKFNWKRSSGANDDEVWNNKHKGVGNTLVVTHADVNNSTHFWCEVDI